jgi:hypothetical protein
MDDLVQSLAVFDDGGNPALFAGGEFTTAGGAAASRIAKWDGSSWSPLGSGMGGGAVHVLTTFDDGSGPALYAGGEFVSAGGVGASKIARWDGSSWSAMGSGLDHVGGASNAVHALAAFDDGSGPLLHAGGKFATTAGLTVNNLATWSGSSWLGLGNGISGIVSALEVFDDGTGSALYMGGSFTSGTVEVSNIAKWDGSSLSALGSGTDGPVGALAVFDDGSGPALYAGGNFTMAGGVAASNIAKWDGSTWSPLGDAQNPVNAFAVFDDGGGPALYAGGSFNSIGGVAAKKIAKWDGSSWSALGSGLGSHVQALAAFDDGNGPALYAGGNFSLAGGQSALHIARWDGSSWSSLGVGPGNGTNGHVLALIGFDDGSGPVLHVGGAFSKAGGIPVGPIARWDGSSWSSVGTWQSGSVEDLVVFDDGGGPALYAGGTFAAAGGVAANSIAKWDGGSWSALGGGMGGMSSTVSVLDGFDDGVGPALYAGGNFNVNPAGDSNLAKWGCPAPSPETYCTAGTSASGCQALLSATGTPSASAASGFTLTASTVEGHKDGLFFFGTNGQQANPWGNGTSYQCVAPPVKRTPTLPGVGANGVCDGSFALDFNALWCPSCPNPGKNPGVGATVQAQLWYRDPASTSNQTTSLSDAIEFTVDP